MSRRTTRQAVVVDVAASWQDYRRIRDALAAAAPAGLLLHAAGATDEGFRTIDIWDCEDAVPSYRALLMGAYDDLSVAPMVRVLQVDHLLVPINQNLEG